MVGELIIIGGLGIVYYLIQKKQTKGTGNNALRDHIESLIPEHQQTKAEKLALLMKERRIKAEKTLAEDVRKAAEADAERRRLRDLEVIKQKDALTSIIEQSEIIAADTSADTAYREMAARFVEQERLKVEAARKLNLEAIIERTKDIIADTSYSVDYRSDAAKFAHQEQRRKEGWSKAEWQKEWRDMLLI